MSTPKYKKFYQLMIDNNRDLFDKFQPIHDQYQSNQENEKQFHTVGRDVLDVIRDWERRLCHGMEKGKYATYSAKLADKFWGEVKKDLPLIEEVGVIKN